jgi:hypothetical protein
MLEVPDSEVDAGSDDEDDRKILVRRAVELVLSRCRDETRRAFLRVVIDGEQPADVARDLGLTPPISGPRSGSAGPTCQAVL